MAKLCGLFQLSVLFTFLFPATSDRCPTFANAKSSCSSSTCGHFVYKGQFVDEIAKKHRMADMADGLNLNPSTSTPASCCNLCRQTAFCAYWSYNVTTGLCLVYNEGLCRDSKPGFASTASNTAVYDPEANLSYVGGFCLHPVNEESAVAASGQPKPIPEKAFCLVSDANIHINMLLGGYLDPRVHGASSVRNGLTIRTWIKELGVIWKSKGKSHTLHMGARRGPERSRADGYLDFITVDGTSIPRLTLGDELNLFDGQAVVSFDAYEKMGPYDVDVYKVKIQGLLEAEMRLRIAHPLLQLENDAEVHINMDILDLDYSNSVHGVLGQTYRADRLDQALNYAALSDLMFGTTTDAGDGTSIDSLDGTVSSYVSSSITAPDCAFSQFFPLVPETKPSANLRGSGQGAGEKEVF